MPSRFPLGRVVITVAAACLVRKGAVLAGLQRHATADWGDVPPDDWNANEFGLENGCRLVSSYKDTNGTAFRIVTESDRSCTTVTLPDNH